jgi:hypothetical protein
MLFSRSNRRRRLVLETLEPRALMAFDPTPIEEELFLYVNRMRTDPQGEYDRLISSTNPLVARDPDVNNSVQYFGVDGNLLRSQWNSLLPVAPLAWNESLYNAAHAHNAAMIAAQSQQHQLPGEPAPSQRLTNAGYSWSSYGENIFAYAKSAIEAHAAFAIDWGGSVGGMQSPPGHRNNIMTGTHREAGIAIDSFHESGVFFGPLVVTQDFASRSSIGNPFVVGAVWNDVNHNGWYNAGEGLDGVTLEFTKAGSAPVSVTSMSAGGYQVQLANGTYSATAHGGALPFDLDMGTITVSGANVMLNFVKPDGVSPTAGDDRAATVRNTAVTIAVKANDSDPDGSLAAAAIQITSAPVGSTITVDQAAGTITFKAASTFTGGTEFRYRLRDAQGFLSPDARVTIAVSDEAHPRQNPINLRDIDFDGQVTPVDALIIINELNATGPRSLNNFHPGQNPVPFIDPSGDNSLSPLDAVNIINFLNAGGDGEEAPVEPTRNAAASPEFDSLALLDPFWLFYWWDDEATKADA